MSAVFKTKHTLLIVLSHLYPVLLQLMKVWVYAHIAETASEFSAEYTPSWS